EYAFQPCGELPPGGLAGFERLPAGGGEPVILSPASLGFLPVGGEQLLALELVQRGVEAALLQFEATTRASEHRLRDLVAVARAVGKNFEHEQLDRSGKQFRIHYFVSQCIERRCIYT